MKKHKVKIPKGYILVNETSSVDGKGMTITLGLEPIPMESTVKKELPKTWEELEIVRGYYVDSNCLVCKCDTISASAKNKSIWPTKDLAEAALALSQLTQLRDHYNDGCSEDGHYSIINNKYNGPGKEIMISDSRRGPLSFVNGDRCEMFFSNFRDLLETAKPLL